MPLTPRRLVCCNALRLQYDLCAACAVKRLSVEWSNEGRRDRQNHFRCGFPGCVFAGCLRRNEAGEVLKEAIDVRGTCSEDHVRQSDEYDGQIVRWQMADTGKIFTYGFLSKKGNLADQILDEVTNPYVYHTPRQISFLEIDVDTNQPKWTLHGVSDRGESPEDSIQGYNSTCDVEVTKRGMEIRLPMELAGATNI